MLSYYKCAYLDFFLTSDANAGKQSSDANTSGYLTDYHRFGWLLFLALHVHVFSRFKDLVTCTNGLVSIMEDLQNLSTATGEKGDDLIRVLRELTVVQRKIADLQVELQGRKVRCEYSMANFSTGDCMRKPKGDKTGDPQKYLWLPARQWRLAL